MLQSGSELQSVGARMKKKIIIIIFGLINKHNLKTFISKKRFRIEKCYGFII
jgi:hypothetical protein